MILAMLALVACSQQPTQQSQTGGVVTEPSTGNTVEVNITASEFKFDPGVVNAHVGDKVIIHLTSADDEHGIAIEGYNVHVEAQPGDTQTLEFIADKAGTFTFKCNVPCGSGHRDMTGQLIVAA